MYFFSIIKIKNDKYIIIKLFIIMKLFINCVVFTMIICDVLGFKLNMCNNNDLHLKNNKKSKIFERQIYARYLIDKRKIEKKYKTNTFIKENIDNLPNELVNNISEYDNENANIKKLIIGNNIYIDVKNVKNIIISTNNDNITIELDKSEKKNNNNELLLLSKNIKDLDTLLNLLDIFLNILK